MRSILLAGLALATLVTAGCAATVTADAYPPDLVYAAPGVQVIADYDEPIFYNDGFYWRFYGGGWYRSTYYTGGWVYARPPVAVMRIDRPYAYAHYRPAGWQGHPRTGPQPVAGGWRGGGAAPPPTNGGWRAGPAPAQPVHGGGWRGGPAQAPAAGRAPVGGGWRGGAAAPAPVPQQAHPGPARPAPRSNGGGWHGHH
jgi:hypothetical protein